MFPLLKKQLCIFMPLCLLSFYHRPVNAVTMRAGHHHLAPISSIESIAPLLQETLKGKDDGQHTPAWNMRIEIDEDNCRLIDITGGMRPVELRIDQDFIPRIHPADRRRIAEALSSEYMPVNNIGSVFVTLKHPPRGNQHEKIVALQIKRIAFDSRNPIEQHEGLGRAPYTTFIDDAGQITLISNPPSPQGAMLLDLARHEFALTRRCYRNSRHKELVFKTPIGWGRFPGVMFQGQPIGFVVLGVTRPMLTRMENDRYSIKAL